MVSRRRCAGFSLLEGTIALAVITVVAGAFIATGPQQLRAIGGSFRATAAMRLAEGVLEEARNEALSAGDAIVDLPAEHAPDDASATRTAREIEPGLWEVTAVVTWTEPGEDEPREARLVTLIAKARTP